MYASVLFRGVKSTRMRSFELGTPQGGVLSPMLFNILMHKLIADIPVQPNEAVICYADDICIMTQTKLRLQALLDVFARRTVECGLIISVDKTRVLNPRPAHPLPLDYNINSMPLELCSSYKYLGICVNDANFVSNLRDKLMQRIKPLRTLVGKGYGINITYARTFYLHFIRSVVDYHALHLVTIPPKQLNSLEVVQNEAMRIILGCPKSTRIVNMRKELGLPSLSERIALLNTMFCVKVLKNNSSQTTTQTELMFYLSNPDHLANLPQKTLFGAWLHKSVADLLKLNVPITPDEPINAIPPWLDISVPINYTPVGSKQMLNTDVVRCVTLETINRHIESIKSSECYAFTDGSVQTNTGRTGCAIVIYKEKEMIVSNKQRLDNWASTTRTELTGI